jgi:hypothetical protein
MATPQEQEEQLAAARYLLNGFKTSEEAARELEAKRIIPQTGAYQTQTFYSILFSLGPAKENRYLDCLQIQLAALRRTKMLRDDDRYVLLCDKETAEEVKKMILIPKQLRILIAPKPKSLYEGMRLKYLFPFVVSPPLHPNEVAIYLDLDVMPIRQCDFFKAPAETILCVPEGDPTRPDYCGDKPLNQRFGITAGFFVYRWGQKMMAFFNEMLRVLDAGRSDFYTLDQPHFNHLLDRVNCKAYFQPTFISFNGHGNLKEAFFVNFAGEPGDSVFHATKMLRFFIQTIL